MRDYFHDETETKTFFPTKGSYLNSEEWQKFDFDEEEEEILKQKDFLIDLTQEEDQVELKSHQETPEPDSEVTPPWVEEGDFPSREKEQKENKDEKKKRKKNKKKVKVWAKG